MGQGEPQDGSGAGGLRATLARWEDAGAQWRVGALAPDRAEVLLCACTGETVDVLEVTDPAALDWLAGRADA